MPSKDPREFSVADLQITTIITGAVQALEWEGSSLDFISEIPCMALLGTLPVMDL
jgi:hypothetical protein